MDRSARTSRVARIASYLEVLDRAPIEADLPGILQAHGWRAVPGEDAQERRVLTDQGGTRRVVVSRHPESQRWQWWDAALGMIGGILEAIRQLISLQSFHDIITLLRHALDNPPEPLLVPRATDENAVPTHASDLSTEYHSVPFEVDHSHAVPLAGPDEVIAGTPSEEQTQEAETLLIESVEAVDDQPANTQENSDTNRFGNDVLAPPTKGRGRR